MRALSLALGNLDMLGRRKQGELWIGVLLECFVQKDSTRIFLFF